MSESASVTGRDLVDRIRRRAIELRVPIATFAAPLSTNASRWLWQMEQAERPKPHTIARVEALLAGREVPPPPANNFQASPRKPAVQYASGRRDPENYPAPVDRDPCPFCGTRRDLGCRHTKGER